MIIGISGYGYSGASAYIDVLKEFDGIQFLPGNNEFPILQQTDGILDLKHALLEDRRRLNINNAIVRFIRNSKDVRYNKLEKLSHGEYSRISKEYIDSLTDISWKGKSKFDPGDLRSVFEDEKLRFINRCIRVFLRCFNKHVVWPLPPRRYFTYITPERFQIETCNYLKKVLISLGLDLEQDVILEQVFNTINPVRGAEFFDTDVLSIIVDRDPRDIYLLTNILRPELCGFMPCNQDVESFVYYYKNLHNASTTEGVLRLNFEDLIYHYEDSIAQLEQHLGKKNTQRGKFFQPERSINNTQMFKNYQKYSRDFEYIEMHCKEYLYDFNSIDNTNKINRIKVKPF